MKKTVMIVGHPYWNASVANRAIVKEFSRLDPSAEISNLAELYPHGSIDVEAEQRKLLDADAVILQFPIMWYSCPSIMHKWMEEVLAYGFAYGSTGDKLKGKRLIASFTSGAPTDMYSRDGAQGMTIDDLMPPFAGVARHCQMIWSEYVYSGGMMLLGNADDQQLATLKERAKDHAYRLYALISGKDLL